MTRPQAICIAGLFVASCVKHREEPPPPSPHDTGAAAAPDPAFAEDASSEQGEGDVKVVKMRRDESTTSTSTPTTLAPGDGPPEDQPVAGGGTGIAVACDFAQGFVAVLPISMFDPGEEFLMQGLIGLTEEPSFWRGLPEFAKLEPFRAQRCDRAAHFFALAPGRYVVAVGMAGQFKVKGAYKDNGFLSEMEIADGDRKTVKVTTSDLKHTWKCISCPYLVVVRDGERVDVGQVLVDRYTRRRYGTDVVTTRAEVVDGVLVVRLEEREPEVSFVDAVSVRVGEKALVPVRRSPRATRAVDADAVELVLGDALELRFDASDFEDGPLEVEIAVSGHYEPIGPLL